MTWIKLDDKTPRHPKIAGLSDRAFRAWVSSLCYASEFLTDGLVPSAFLIGIKSSVRDELVKAGLWIDRGSVFTIHDYLTHQTSRESVENERRRNRDRRRSERGTTSNSTTGTPSVIPRPEAEADTEVPLEHRRQKQQNGHAAAPLILSPLAYERRKQQCAFVGARLEVPHGLHGDLRKLIGGANAETDLLAWYADLDVEIEASGEKITPDVFRWLKARYAQWTDAAGREKTTAEIMAEIALLPKGVGR